MPNRRMPIRLLIPLTETVVAKILTCAVVGALTGGVLYVALHPISYGIVNLCLLAGASCGISWAINPQKSTASPYRISYYGRCIGRSIYVYREKRQPVRISPYSGCVYRCSPGHSPPSAHTARSEEQPLITTRYRHAYVPQSFHSSQRQNSSPNNSYDRIHITTRRPQINRYFQELQIPWVERPAALVSWVGIN